MPDTMLLIESNSKWRLLDEDKFEQLILILHVYEELPDGDYIVDKMNEKLLSTLLHFIC